MNKKLKAIKEFINLANKLNGDWQPIFSFKYQIKYFIYYNVGWSPGYKIGSTMVNDQCIAYFKSEEIAKKVIKEYKELLDQVYGIHKTN